MIHSGSDVYLIKLVYILIMFYCESSQTEFTKTIESSTLWRNGLLKRSPQQGSQLFQLSVKGMSVQADGNSWKGRTKHRTSLLYSTIHVQSPDRPGNLRLHTADEKRNTAGPSTPSRAYQSVGIFFKMAAKNARRAVWVVIYETLIQGAWRKAPH